VGERPESSKAFVADPCLRQVVAQTSGTSSVTLAVLEERTVQEHRLAGIRVEAKGVDDQACIASEDTCKGYFAWECLEVGRRGVGMHHSFVAVA
jgi:hypothetical protein